MYCINLVNSIKIVFALGCKFLSRWVVGKVMTFLAITVVVTGKLIDHIGSEKNPMLFCTAVRNIGQWPQGWTSNLEEWKCICINTIVVKPHKILNRLYIMTKSIYKSWPNYVPAVAVIRRRLVLVIFIGFKG